MIMNHKTLKNSTFSILGDSYSTYQGYIPQGNACYYPRPEMVDDVLRMEDTWWHQLAQKHEMRLVYNNSYSGATVCNQVRETQPPESAFVVRAHYLAKHTDADGKKPDYIFLFGCTNDSWLGRNAGQVQYENWTEEDLKQVLPAYCNVLHTLRQENPDSVLVCVINTNLTPEIAEGTALAAEHYGAVAVKLSNISKQHGHPSKLGMQQIAEQIETALNH